MKRYIFFAGRTGWSYAFQLNPIGTRYKKRPGVYVFCHCLPNGDWMADYIGETGDFDKRLSKWSELEPEFDSHLVSGATHIGTLHVPEMEVLRLVIASDLRLELNQTTIDDN